MLTALLHDSRAKLLSYLATRSGGDLSEAEDALSDAVLDALQQWPAEGVPAKPEAWLLTVARRRLCDEQRRDATRHRFSESLQQAIETAHITAETMDAFPDERLKLLMVCAHPAIDETMRTPLMLQVVLGLEASAIASAFLVAPSAMAQRLVRVKAKIKAAAIPFAVPQPAECAERLCYALDAVYAAFTVGDSGLIEESIRLGGLLVDLAPICAEAHGLLALMLHSHARRYARTDDAGGYAPLDLQKATRWDGEMIAAAELHLARASAMGQPGRFQIEAAIQSVHAQRRVTGRIDWPAIAALYGLLLRYTDAVGARIGHAVSIGRAVDAAHGLALLEKMERDRVCEHQPFWAAKGHLLAQVGRREEASVAYQRAIGLSADPVVRSYLMRQLL